MLKLTHVTMETISVLLLLFVKLHVDLTLLINKQTYIHIKLILELHMHEWKSLISINIPQRSNNFEWNLIFIKNVHKIFTVKRHSFPFLCTKQVLM